MTEEHTTPFNRLLKWCGTAEIGPLGKVWLFGSIFFSIGIGIINGYGYGYIMYGVCVGLYVVARWLKGLNWSS